MNKTIRNALLDVLIILSTILLILLIPTENLGAILCSYVVLAFSNIRRFIFN